VLTFRLNNGAHVLAREYKGRIEPYTYMTETQARKRADAVGGYVIRPTRAYFVVPVLGAKQ
jgi:hypothetical protein